MDHRTSFSPMSYEVVGKSTMIASLTIPLLGRYYIEEYNKENCNTPGSEEMVKQLVNDSTNKKTIKCK